jgi:hypothetical protein
MQFNLWSVQKIWTDTKHFGTFKRTRQKWLMKICTYFFLVLELLFISYSIFRTQRSEFFISAKDSSNESRSVHSTNPVNTQNMRNSNLVYVPKMEYVHKVNIFGLKMMVKSGLEKIILEFLHAEAIFY